MIYLDNSATSLIKPKVVSDAVVDALTNYTANANRGSYFPAHKVGLKILECREVCKKLYGECYETIFTPSCSYSLNLAIRGIVKNNCHFITTYLEHNSVLRVLESLKKTHNITFTILEDINIETILRAIKRNTIAIVTTHLSNVTGEQVNTKMISEICKEHKLLYILDDAQGAGNIDLDSFPDLIAFSGHKGLKGISGCGGLMVKQGIKLNPIIFGGTGVNSAYLNQGNQIPDDFEVGTQPIIPIISLGAGIDYYLNNKNTIQNQEEKLTKYLIERLRKLSFIKTYFNDKNCNGICSINLRDFDSSLIADLLSERYNICVRSGLHCAPLVHRHFKTLKQGMVRISLSSDNTKEEIDKLINALTEINYLLI